VVRKARQAHLQVRQRLLQELMKIPETERAELPLTEALLDGLAELGRTKQKARRRLTRYLARRVDDEEWGPVELALAARNRRSAAVGAIEKACTSLRDRLVVEGVVALDEVWARFPHADRDRVESLTRAAHGMPNAAKGRKARRALLRVLRDLAERAP